MARVEREMYLVPSILDRLIDPPRWVEQKPGDAPEVKPEPDAASQEEPGLDSAPKEEPEPPEHRFQSLRQLKRCIAWDLEAMLNSRQEALEDVPVAFTEVNRSLLTYGLPDITSLNVLSMQDCNRIRRTLEQAIVTFEPRLDRVKVILDPPRQYERLLRFRVEARLLVKPAPESVVFDSMLQLNTQKYVVRG